MFAVREILRMNNGLPVLVCDLFHDTDVTDNLSTDIGVFGKKDFSIGQIRSCFSEPKTRMIMLRTKIDCSGIKNVKFI